MTNLLDTPLADLQADRRLLDQVLKAIALNEQCSYAVAYEKFNAGLEEAAYGTGPTLRRALDAAALDTAGLDQNVKLLDQRDLATAATYKSTAPKKRPKTDAFGRALVSPKLQKRLDADGKLTSRKQHEKRLQRARTLEPRYRGDAGRNAFAIEDTAGLGAGVDLVKTLELAHADQAARAKADGVRLELDQGIAEHAARRSEMKQLDGELGELQSQRAKLEAQEPDGPLVEELRMLDHGTDAPKKRKKLDAAELDRAARKMDKRARKRMERLDCDYVIALEQERAGLPMPPRSAAMADTPTGLHPGSHDLHQRISKYLLDNELPQSAYPTVLDEYVTGRLKL